ncbi:MAG: tetratricopeptide repeat protein [Bacteroidia bacterium]
MPEYYKLNQSGYQKTKEKNFEGAIQDFDSSIKLNDAYWPAYLNRGTSYAIEGNCKSAMADFNKSISLHPHNPFAFDNRGLCKSEMHDSIGAIADFRQALALDSKYNIVYTHLGLILANLDSCEQAIYYLKIAQERKAYDPCNNEQLVIQMISKCEGMLAKP